jgi:phosphoketolase
MIKNVTSNTIKDTNIFPIIRLNTMKAKRLSICKLINDDNNNLFYTVYPLENQYIVHDRFNRMYVIDNVDNMDKLTYDNIDTLVCSL